MAPRLAWPAKLVGVVQPATRPLLTDHAMPGMTGTQLAAIRAKQLSLPILLATGYAELPQGSEPALPMLGKPFGQESLARAIGDILDRAHDGIK